MRTVRFSLAVIGLVLLVGTGIASAESFYYEQTSTTTQQGSKRPTTDVVYGWVDGQKVRIQFGNEAQGGRVQEGMYLLTTDAGETVYMVNPEEKQYYEFDLSNLLSGVQAATGGMVELEFSDVKMEKLGQKDGGSLHGRATTNYQWRTGFVMSMNVMGMKRRDQIDTMQDVWMAEGLGSDAWTMWMKMMPASMKDEDFVKWAEREGLTNSFPLKSRAVTRTTTKKGKTTEMTSEMEVTELRVEPIDGSTFEIPAGYTKAEMLPAEWSGEGAEAGGPMKQLKGMFGKKKKKKDGGA